MEANVAAVAGDDPQMALNAVAAATVRWRVLRNMPDELIGRVVKIARHPAAGPHLAHEDEHRYDRKSVRRQHGIDVFGH